MSNTLSGPSPEEHKDLDEFLGPLSPAGLGKTPLKKANSWADWCPKEKVSRNVFLQDSINLAHYHFLFSFSPIPVYFQYYFVFVLVSGIQHSD